MTPTLPQIIIALLERAQVPLPGRTLQQLAAALRGAPVPAERLARIAGYERDRFAETRRPPRLCVALDEEGVELRPRMWALASWRLARRILTEDVASEWHVQAALLALAVRREQRRDVEELWSLAVTHALQGLGKVEDSSADALELQLRASLPAVGAANHTAGQTAAEARLQADPSFTGRELYFGRTPAALTATAASPSGLRPALPGEDGTPFAQLVLERAGSLAEALDVLAFVDEWAALRAAGVDPLDHEAYARRSEATIGDARARHRRFERIFPGERDPSRVAEMLARGAPHQRFVRSLTLPVVDAASGGARVVVEREAARDGKWMVSDAAGARSVHETRDAAVASARALARAAPGGELRIHDASGRLRETAAAGEQAASPHAATAPDAIWRDPDGTAIVIEFKSTNWDALVEDHIVRNAQRHARALLEMATRQAAAERVRAAVLQYPRRPSTPGRAELVEHVIGELGCAVVWEDAPAPARSGA